LKVLAPLLASNALQYTCVVVAGFALQWLVTELTESRALLGAVAFAQGATTVALTPLGGVLADRRARRGLIARARLALAAALMATGVLVASGAIELWSALLAALAASALAAAIGPAVPAYIGELAAPGGLQRAIAIDTTGSALAQVVGPAGAGLLIPLAGVAAVYAGSGAGLVGAAALLLLVPPSSRRDTPAGGSAWSSLRAALAHVIAHPPLLLALLGASLAVFNGALYVLRPVFARHVLEVGAQGFGWMTAAGGAGTLVGSLGAAALPPRQRYGVAITAAMLVYALCLVAYSHAPSLAWVLVIEVAAGVAGSLWTVWVISGFQLAVPEALRGRVLSLVLALSNFGFVGYAPVGALADALGDRVAMRIFGLIPSAALALLLLLGYRTLRRM
jgi:MFS family permease